MKLEDILGEVRAEIEADPARRPIELMLEKSQPSDWVSILESKPDVQTLTALQAVLVQGAARELERLAAGIEAREDVDLGAVAYLDVLQQLPLVEDSTLNEIAETLKALRLRHDKVLLQRALGEPTDEDKVMALEMDGQIVEMAKQVPEIVERTEGIIAEQYDLRTNNPDR